MNRTTIMLPSELKGRALRQAKKMGVSFGALVRESLEVFLSRSSDSADDDPLFADKAVFSGDAPSDLSRDHDRYLYEEEA